MKFLLLSKDWQEKTMKYYINSLSSENSSISLDAFPDGSIYTGQKPVKQDKIDHKVEQAKLSAFFAY